MRIAAAVALVPIYFIFLAIGPSDDPAMEMQALFDAIVTALFTLAFLRVSGARWWIPPLIVGLMYFWLHYPVQTLTGYLQADPASENSGAWFLGLVRFLDPVATIGSACAAAWIYKKLRSVSN
jgi:hypothetical protein